MLKGKTAVVSGSTSGIGLGMARALAEAGAGIVLNGFNPSPAEEALVAEISAANKVPVTLYGADLTKVDACEGLIAHAVKEHGSVDILVNNAGVQHVAPIEDFPVAKWDQIIALNLTSAFHLTRLAVPHMKKAGYGRIINLSSAHGIVASPFKSAYVAAKHGLNGLTKVVALETAELDITCNAICPGYVFTPLVEKQIDDQAKAHGIPREQVINDVILAPQPKKRFAEVDEIGALCVFLCSDHAKSITGIQLPVDGGWTAR